MKESSTMETLRDVVERNADKCFQDTDRVTRDAARMTELMDRWLPDQTDHAARVKRNVALNPHLPVVVADGRRIIHASSAPHPGGVSLLFTIVSRDH